MVKSVEEQLMLLTAKVDRILSLLEGGALKVRNRASEHRAQKPKPQPLGPEEISRNQERFERLFALWDSGEEVQVEKELEGMEVDEIRRFADANNLNVAAKTPKQRVMQLVAGRFRERRQLMRTHFNRRPPQE
jgi:hypothetical protein